MNKRLGVWVMALALMLSGCALLPGARKTSTSVSPDWPLGVQQQVAEYDLVVRSLRDAYIDPRKVDAAWQAKAAALRAKFSATTTDTEYAQIVADLLRTLDDDALQVTSLQSAASTAPRPSGIGVLVDLPSAGKDRVLVLAVYDDGPAQRAGIKPHDAIVAVEGRAVRGDDPGVLARIVGQAGTQVTLSVRTPGQAPRDVQITRRAIPRTIATAARILPGTNFGYIQPSPSIEPEQMRLDVTAALRQLSTERVLDGLVLDLRVQRGPDWPLADMLSLFANGAVASRFTRGSGPNPILRSAQEDSRLTITGRNVVGSQTVPLIVLVSDLTSGDAEALAGILQDLERAYVIGNKTMGNHVIYKDVTLPASGLRLRVPTAEYRGLKGNGWLNVGVTPNSVSPATWEQFGEDNDPQLQAAVQQLGKH